MSKKHLLVIDDEADLLTLLESRLRHSGYEVSTALTAASGLAAATQGRPDLILLDISLPDGDGFDVCKSLRSQAATRRIPVIMLTARGAATDEVLGLELGADDYVTKPYDYRVLETRIKRLLGRESAAAGSGASDLRRDDDVLASGDLTIDLRARRVRIADKEIDLTPLEYRILALLASDPRRVFSREELIETTWKNDKDVSRAIKVNNHINNLRKKLGPCADRVETVHGSGYRFHA